MREDWQRYKAAAETIAASLGTTVICTEKNGRLRVDFNESALTADQVRAVGAIEDLIELVTEFPEGYLEMLAPPA